ncbi:MAG: hypothetical protein ABIL58_28400 [Pseudomonadota bacterium]
MAMMPTCKEMSELVSGAMERKPPFLKRLFMRLHLLMCPNCVSAREQVRLLHEAAGRFDDFCTLEDPNRRLPPEVAERIKAMLNCPPTASD